MAGSYPKAKPAPKPSLREAAKADAVIRRVDRYEGMPFSPGSVVTLTCGGRRLTVVDIRQVCDGSLQVDVIWPALGGDLAEMTLPSACLISDRQDIPF